MKKILILIIIVLLAILTYFLLARNIAIGTWKSTNINDIKALNSELDNKIEEAKRLNNQEYPKATETFEEESRNLKRAKENYEVKKNTIGEEIDLGVIAVKKYKIERLWIALENYAKNEGITLKLNILNSAASDVYDLDIELSGEYQGIMEFIYDVENDDTLGFKILNFKLLPQSTARQEGENTVTTINPTILTATFKVEGVGIEFN